MARLFGAANLQNDGSKWHLRHERKILQFTRRYNTNAVAWVLRQKIRSQLLRHQTTSEGKLIEISDKNQNKTKQNQIKTKYSLNKYNTNNDE